MGIGEIFCEMLKNFCRQKFDFLIMPKFMCYFVKYSGKRNLDIKHSSSCSTIREKEIKNFYIMHVILASIFVDSENLGRNVSILMRVKRDVVLKILRISSVYYRLSNYLNENLDHEN